MSITKRTTYSTCNIYKLISKIVFSLDNSLWVKMNTVNKAVFGLFFGCLLVAFSLCSARAFADSLSLTIAPSSTSIVANRGSTTKGSLQVSNNNVSSSYPVQLLVTPYSVKGEDYIPDFSPLPHSTSIVNWLTLSTQQVTLNSSTSATISYTLKVPSSALPGSYFGVVFAQVQLPKISQGITINERVGDIFYITVAGPAKKTGGIYSWTSSILQKRPLQATLKMEDSGSVLYFSNIQIAVKDLFGGTKYTYIAKKVILPETIRRIPFEWPNSPSFGLFKINGSVTVFGQKRGLSTHYILIMSSKVRSIFLTVIILLFVLFLLKYIVGKIIKSRRRRQE